MDTCQAIEENRQRKETNPICFVANFSCRLIKLLLRILRCLFRRLGSLVHLFLSRSLGFLSSIGRLALGRTQGMFGGIYRLLATIDGASETLSHRLIGL